MLIESCIDRIHVLNGNGELTFDRAVGDLIDVKEGEEEIGIASEETNKPVPGVVIVW